MNDNFLTPDGRQRRSRILQLAIGEARRRRRRRWIAPGTGVAVILAVIGIASWRPSHHEIHAPLIPPSVARITTPASQPGIVIEYLATDPTITDRLSIKPEPPRWTRIGDDELLTELAAAGQPAGLAYVNGRAILLPRNKGTGTIFGGN